MKTTKILAFAMMALAFVACKKSDDNNAGGGGQGVNYTITLDESSLDMTVDDVAVVTATVSPSGTVEWSLNAAFDDCVVITADGNKCTIKATAKGVQALTAKIGDATARVSINVKEKGADPSGDKVVKGSAFYPIYMDAETKDKNASKMGADFTTDDVNCRIDIWSAGETYAAATCEGNNFFGTGTEYFAMVTTNAGWSGGAFVVFSAERKEDLKKLVAAIQAAPNDYFLHMAIKSNKAGNHGFGFLGKANFTLGSAAVDDTHTLVIGNFDRDGDWAEFDIPMSTLAAGVAEFDPSDIYSILSFTSGAVEGNPLNLDAVYVYKK